MKRFLLLTAAAACLNAGVATAQTGGAPAADAFLDAVEDSIGEMRIQPNCVGHRDRYRLAFIGIPEGDPRLTASERAQLNNALRSALRQSRVPLTPSSAENAGILATLTQAIDMDAAEFEERLSQLEADFTVLVRTQRPGPETALLQISVFARPGDGGPGCDELVNVAIDLPTMTRTYDAPLAGDFRTLDGAVGPFLLRNVERIRDAETIAWRVDSGFPEACPLPGNIASQLDAIYFQAARTHAGASIGGADFPGIVGDPEAADILLTARVSPSAVGEPVVSLALSLADNGVLFDRLDHQIVHGAIPASCEGLATAMPVEPEQTEPVEVVEQEPEETENADVFEPIQAFGMLLTPTEMELSGLYNAGEGPHLVVTDPGDASALEPGDVLVQVSGETLTGFEAFEALVLAAQEAEEPALTVLVDRGGEPRFVAMDVPEPPTPTEVLGLSLLPVRVDLPATYGDAIPDRLSIVAVDDRIVPDNRDLQEGDVLVEAGQEPISTLADLQAQIDAAREAGENTLVVLVDRDGTPRFAALDLEVVVAEAPEEQVTPAVPTPVEPQEVAEEPEEAPSQEPEEIPVDEPEEVDAPEPEEPAAANVDDVVAAAPLETQPTPSTVTDEPEETPVAADAPEQAAPAEEPQFIKVVANAETFQSGEELYLGFVSPRTCRLTLLQIREDGRSCLVLPHPQLDVVLEANTPYRFPPEPHKLITDELGLETWVALCNAREEVVAQEKANTTPFSCVSSVEEASSGIELESTFVLGGTSEASGDVLRGEVTVEVLP